MYNSIGGKLLVTAADLWDSSSALNSLYPNGIGKNRGLSVLIESGEGYAEYTATGRLPTDPWVNKAGGTVTPDDTGVVSAPVHWDDIVGSLLGRRLYSTVGKVDYKYSENAIKFQPGGDPATLNDQILFNLQYPHAAIENGDMKLHIHWEQTSTDVIEFTTQYRVQHNGAPKATSWETAVANSQDNSVLEYTSGTMNQLTELCTVSLNDETPYADLSTTIQFKVCRTDNTAEDILGTFIDAHVAFDSLGSYKEYTKD